MKLRCLRALALVVACMSILVFAACGDDSSSSTQAGSTDTGSTAKKLSGSITVWDTGYDYVPTYTAAAKKLDAEFEKKYGVKVNHVGQPQTQWQQLWTAAFAAGEGPDVMNNIAGTQGVLRFTKGLMPLNDIITPEQRDNLSGWSGVAANFDPDREIYGIPVGVQGFAMYYNKKLFKRAGLDPDFSPTSWDEVYDAAAKLKAAGITPYADGNVNGLINQWWFTYGWLSANTPEQAVDLSSGKLPYTSPEFGNAFAPEIALQEKGFVAENRYSTQPLPDGYASFIKGETAMTLGLFSGIDYYGNFNPELGVDSVGLFFAPGAKYVAAEPANVWTIPNYTKNKDAAIAYVQFVTDTHAMQVEYEVGAVLPNDRQVRIKADASPQERAIVDHVRSSELFLDPHLMLPGSTALSMQSAINQVLQGQTSLESAQETIQATASKSG